jgi:hypothetical protein
MYMYSDILFITNKRHTNFVAENDSRVCHIPASYLGDFLFKSRSLNQASQLICLLTSSVHLDEGQNRRPNSNGTVAGGFPIVLIHYSLIILFD